MLCVMESYIVVAVVLLCCLSLFYVGCCSRVLILFGCFVLPFSNEGGCLLLYCARHTEIMVMPSLFVLCCLNTELISLFASVSRA